MKTVQDCKASPVWPKFEAFFETKVGRIGARDASLIVTAFKWFAAGYATCQAEWSEDLYGLPAGLGLRCTACGAEIQSHEVQAFEDFVAWSCKCGHKGTESHPPPGSRKPLAGYASNHPAQRLAAAREVDDDPGTPPDLR